MSTVPVLPSVLDGCRMVWAPITFQVGKTACVHVCVCSSTTNCVDLGPDWRGWRCVLAQLYPLCVLRI